jgi:pyruvate/2-oxoglutarate dehydrogenase complex dihydrolipoamide acyltransferase (E2) component
MDLTLSFDHRAVDGAEATRFLVALSRIVENWSGAVA